MVVSLYLDAGQHNVKC